MRAGRAGPGFRNSTQQRRICPCPPQSWRVPRGSRCLPSTASCRPGGYGGRSIVARWGARRVVRYGCAHPSSRPVSVATRVGVASGLAPQTTRTPLTPRLLCGRGDQDPVRSGVHRHNSLGAGSYLCSRAGGAAWRRVGRAPRTAKVLKSTFLPGVSGVWVPHRSDARPYFRIRLRCGVALATDEPGRTAVDDNRRRAERGGQKVLFIYGGDSCPPTRCHAPR